MIISIQGIDSFTFVLHLLYINVYGYFAKIKGTLSQAFESSICVASFVIQSGEHMFMISQFLKLCATKLQTVISRLALFHQCKNRVGQAKSDYFCPRKGGWIRWTVDVNNDLENIVKERVKH